MDVDELRARIPQTGRLEWIGLRRERRGSVTAVTDAEIREGLGLAGDHRAEGRTPDPDGRRHVTLIQAEHLPVVAALLGDDVRPEQTRRNLVVAGVNLLSLKDRRFRIGDAVLEGTGPCHPCSRMETTLGEGGFQAMRGHGGLTARVVTGATVTVGDVVSALPSTPA